MAESDAMPIYIPNESGFAGSSSCLLTFIHWLPNLRHTQIYNCNILFVYPEMIGFIL